MEVNQSNYNIFQTLPPMQQKTVHYLMSSMFLKETYVCISFFLCLNHPIDPMFNFPEIVLSNVI